MSSKFVPAGSSDSITDRDKDWIQAQQELNTKQKERENQKSEDAGKSLYEVLQANKAAKEEAFQESIKLKNQFRALNDDEIDFLDAHADAIRTREQAVRKETDEQLRLFRQKQDAASKLATELPVPLENGSDDPIADLDVTWTTTKKRKRLNEKNTNKGAKFQRSTSDTPLQSKESKEERPDMKLPEKLEANAAASVVAKKPGLSLVSYGSDEDSES